MAGWSGSPDWRSVDLEEADLAYDRAGGAMISLSSSCPRSRATPAALARHVTIGTERGELHAAGPFEVAGAEGWSRVRHADGSVGYVRRSELWGL